MEKTTKDKIFLIILISVFGVYIVLNLTGYLEENHLAESIYHLQPIHTGSVVASGVTASNVSYGTFVRFNGGSEN
ncbi:MAG: hypothetical protein A2423_03270 [Candidatus Levybacteria bacterium RIFOXYC1_FULL_40_10]|nr:MAG: hypothetical protein UT44_C0012G0023 [Candidatus Levybacteria bacterium GW2011_GWA1_39_32]KKR94842.1 MAG: hypothetical protein UU45_C0006G0004 [Candidatus Levybacteria bacterium GW2011_GWA2_41_15]OGH54997.1 MAG: hypothetical protein A2423_03270 [Candidatus Levybacteria bacterium RIFOXYC1_FULL_40_10]OGH70927.1 MAG: hypothetical protein A2396_02430 [Candidatus Levybacteria bacterium RIFOXYB1_FULL_40_17]